MREDQNKQQNKPSQLKTKWQQKPWFWPAIYGGIAAVLIGLIGIYSVVTNEEENPTVAEPTAEEDDSPVIETNAREETLKYPFDESLLQNAKVLQDFYDMNADAKTRENALLVFDQTFTTSSGISISINNEPFEVLAAMSGEVKEVKLDAFTGNKIIIAHPNGMETHYSSVKDILVKKGEKVEQGQPIGTATENEWNPTAGIHLHFEVLENGEHVNPRNYLSF
ncbi:M23 family metallopeptidase [Ureibacillus sp. FSL K6-8385]|uniref:M23 family metallopeptidase n=1 Tax=Ureibacillus terrenus TaxID=118246 RepID=A0A540V2D2_9BACL|nr:M23 family metallopeptidase [Ureibacillus terrenus]MED3661394.1 M23 family metallopeptidase [Ureibacillus terrenus]MED3764133.1 M23 family metallopeptidase [Ureibacillus terrenus]TQE90909.1 M23 family metallopeptidase [Ureibacillus terrenus]